MVKKLMIFLAVFIQQLYSGPFFTVEIGNHEQIRWQQGIMRELINAVITEEVRDLCLALNKVVVPKFSIVGFEAKQRLVLSIVYLTDNVLEVATLAQRAEKNLSEHKIRTGKVVISSGGGLFGVDKDHIVVKIDDRKGYLKKLRSVVINGFDEACIDTKFEFVPHVDLGRLCMPEVIKFVAERNALPQDDVLIKNMRERIEGRLSELVTDIPNNKNLAITVPISSIDLYGFDRKSVRKIALSN